MSAEGSAVREGEGSWWARPSSPFALVGVASSSSAVCRSSPVVVRSCSSFACFASRGSDTTGGEGTAEGASRQLPLGGQWWSRRVSWERGDRGWGYLLCIEYTTTATVSSSSSASSFLPRRLPGACVHSRLCGPWAKRVVHSWPVVVVGGFRGCWSSIAGCCCRC